MGEKKSQNNGFKQQNIWRRVLWNFSGALCECMHLIFTSALWNAQQLPKILTHFWSLFFLLGIQSLTAVVFTNPMLPSRDSSLLASLSWLRVSHCITYRDPCHPDFRSQILTQVHVGLGGYSFLSILGWSPHRQRMIF